MPFTFAHPAIVLPLNYLPRKCISLTALVAGSMAPDFEYFFRMRTYGIYGHTISGIFFFDLPVSLLLAFLFHGIVRNPLVSHLPAFLSARLQVYTMFNWRKHFGKHWPVITLSALTGTGSHLLWDSFTHHNGFFVKLIPSLATSLPAVHFPVYTLLQHGSTALGFLVIGWAVLQLPKSPLAQPPQSDRYYWPAIIIITVVLLAIRMKLQPVSYIGDIVATVVGAGLWALLVTGSIYTIKKDR
jgi:hypothetical protein